MSLKPSQEMSGRSLNPNDLAHRYNELIGDTDGCVFCGYAFTYSLEGCDECAWVKVVLGKVGRMTEEDR